MIKKILRICAIATTLNVLGCANGDITYINNNKETNQFSIDSLTSDQETESAINNIDTNNTDTLNIDTNQNNNLESIEKSCEWTDSKVGMVYDSQCYNWAKYQRDAIFVVDDFSDESGEKRFISLEERAKEKNTHVLGTGSPITPPWPSYFAIDSSLTPDLASDICNGQVPCTRFTSYGVDLVELGFEGRDESKQEDGITAISSRYTPDINNLKSEAELYEIIENSSIPILIKFGATWCGPCAYSRPRLEMASEEFGNLIINENGNYVRDAPLIKIIDIDVDDFPEITKDFNVTGIPDMRILIDKKLVAHESGALPYHILRDWIQNSIGQLDEPKKPTYEISCEKSAYKTNFSEQILEQNICILPEKN